MTKKVAEICKGCANLQTHCTCTLRMEMYINSIFSFTNKLKELGTEEDVRNATKVVIKIRQSNPN